MYFRVQPVALAENTEGNMGKSGCDFNISNTEYMEMMFSFYCDIFSNARNTQILCLWTDLIGKNSEISP